GEQQHDDVFEPEEHRHRQEFPAADEHAEHRDEVRSDDGEHRQGKKGRHAGALGRLALGERHERELGTAPTLEEREHRRRYSGWMPACLTSVDHLAISLLMKPPSCCGFIGATSVPIAANFSCTSSLE